MKIMLDDKELQYTYSATYLVITFDKRQTCRNSVGECIYRNHTTTHGVRINNTGISIKISIKISNLHIRLSPKPSITTYHRIHEIYTHKSNGRNNHLVKEETRETSYKPLIKTSYKRFPSNPMRGEMDAMTKH